MNENAENTPDHADLRAAIEAAVFESGSADMQAAVYDPQGKRQDVFDWGMERTLYDPADEVAEAGGIMKAVRGCVAANGSGLVVA